MDFNLPNKPAFRRREVVRLVKLEGRVLDFWEREFGGFQPIVDEHGETVYSKQDVETIMTIKHLLIVEKKNKQEIKKAVEGNRERLLPGFPGEKELIPVEEKKTDREQEDTAASAEEQEGTRENSPRKEKTGKKIDPPLMQMKSIKSDKNNPEILPIIRSKLQEILTILDKNGKT